MKLEDKSKPQQLYILGTRCSLFRGTYEEAGMIGI